MEKILSIEEVTFGEDGWSGYDGIAVTTDKALYEAGIDNHSQCCENWGYLFNEDSDAQSYIGATLLSVDSDGTFTRFHTDRGALDFTAYNEHNGYYSHHTVLRKNGEIIEQGSV